VVSRLAAGPGTGPPPGHAANDLLIVHRDEDNRIEVELLLAQHGVKCLGLADSARVAIEDKRLRPAAVAEAVCYEVVDQFIGHRPPFDVGQRLERRFVADGLPQDVAGADVLGG
jgi:hypothetical protein